MTWARRGVSLEQRTHRTVMFQSFFVTWHFVRKRLRTPLIAPMPATALRGTGPLRSLRKACALSCASPSTAEIRVELSSRLFSIRGSFGPDYRAVIISLYQRGEPV